MYYVEGQDSIIDLEKYKEAKNQRLLRSQQRQDLALYMSLHTTGKQDVTDKASVPPETLPTIDPLELGRRRVHSIMLS